MPLDTYQLPENRDGLDESRFTITDRQRRTIDRLARHLPEKVFSLYCLAVGAGTLDRLHTLSEFAAGQLILGLQSGDPASVAVSRPMAGTVEGLLEFNGYNATAPH
ncbi:hypothetical protein ACIGDM_13350 [Rothia koreensis]|uniref:hypothetical protein n=1 Tax=Rothia koreensis TaxID=592378 RepID=UPI0037C6C0A6